MNINLKKPCANCPFLKDGAIELQEGRLEGIVNDLDQDDRNNFQCHKTVYSKSGGEWVENAQGENEYMPSGNESMCIGSAIYQLKRGRPSISLRIALMHKLLNINELNAQAHLIKDAP